MHQQWPRAGTDSYGAVPTGQTLGDNGSSKSRAGIHANSVPDRLTASLPRQVRMPLATEPEQMLVQRERLHSSGTGMTGALQHRLAGQRAVLRYAHLCGTCKGHTWCRHISESILSAAWIQRFRAARILQFLLVNRTVTTAAITGAHVDRHPHCLLRTTTLLLRAARA